MTVEKIILLICACIWGISAIINFVCIYINRIQIKKENIADELIERQKEHIDELWRALEHCEANTINELLKEIGNIPYGDMYVADFDWYIEICEKYGVEIKK